MTWSPADQPPHPRGQPVRRTISLDGSDWTIEGFLGLEPALHAAARGPLTGRDGIVPASVPGSILDDLWRGGRVADPYVGLGSLAAEWVPARTWVYRRTINVPALGEAERAFLAFDGLDHAGYVVWDGEVVHRHEGMFVPFEVDLTERLQSTAADSHDLAVVVETAPDSEPQGGRTSRVRVHKSRMGYGWDFCPRLIHQGLWQSVRLEIVGAARIVDVWARPRLAADLRTATIEIEVVIDASSERQLTIEARLRDETTGETATTVHVPAGRSTSRLRMDVREPAMWWPNGMGQPVVDKLDVSLRDGTGVTDARSVPVGFRTVQRIPNDGAPDGARPWTWVVNGRRTYVRGWNWVPIDALYGVPRPERLSHLLRLGADAHVNLLRVWGGGLIETRAFYEACDRLGLMVWQEFAQSSSGGDSVPASDPDFVERMAREAESIVPLRRNHPSLVAWCGGNELEGPDGPLDDTTSVLGALSDVVARLDPDRVWLPTSPSGPRFANRLDVIDADPEGLHDVHGPWEHQGLRGQYELYDRGTSLFNSEFGVEGMTNERTLDALIPTEQRWPATRANRVYRHLGDWWNNEPLVQNAFDGRLIDLATLRRASQHLQADGLRYAIEANRRRAFHNGGSIPWQFNESYPNASCTSAVDHRGDPKPAYFAVRRAYSSVMVAARLAAAAYGRDATFRAELSAWSDEEAGVDAVLTARIRGVDGADLVRMTSPIDLAPGSAVRAGEIQLEPPLPSLFVLDLELGDARGTSLAMNRYLVSGRDDLSPMLDIGSADVRAEVAARDELWTVALTNVGGPVALGLRLEDARPIADPGWAVTDDGWFDLFPGESRTVKVAWTDGRSGSRCLRLSGWNVADAWLTA